MKTFPAFFLFCALFVLHACSPYHYAPQLPATPMFTDGGQCEIQGSLGFNHGQAQVSYSPIKGLGISSNHFISYDSGMAHGLTLYYYKKLRSSPILATFKIGYERGLLTNSLSIFQLSASGTKNYKTSNYYSNLVSAGIYWKTNKRIWFELDLTLTKTTFISVNNHEIEWERNNVSHAYFTNFGQLERVTYGTMVSMRFDGKRGRFFLKQSLGINLTLSNPIKLINSDASYSQIQTYYYTKTLYNDYFLWMITVGLRIGKTK